VSAISGVSDISDISDSPDGAVALALANCLNALFELRDLRTDVTAARSRAEYLNKEFSSLSTDRNRANEAKDRLEALSRELSRQNKAMLDKQNNKLLPVVVLPNNSSRDAKRDYAIERLRNAVKDAEERYIIRGQLFDTRIRRKKLENHLLKKRNALIQEKEKEFIATKISLKTTHENIHRLSVEKVSYVDTNAIYINQCAIHSEKLDKLRMAVAGYKAKNYEGFETVKELQGMNQKKRNENQATRVQIKMLAAEEARLEENINIERDMERKERTKREMLESLFQKVTVERAELKKDVVILSESWSNLKIDIDKLKGNAVQDNGQGDEGESIGLNGNDGDGDNDGNRVFDVLQSIMNREYLEGAVSGVMVGSAIEDAIKHLRTAARETLALPPNGKKKSGKKKNKSKTKNNPAPAAAMSGTPSKSKKQPAMAAAAAASAPNPHA